MELLHPIDGRPTLEGRIHKLGIAGALRHAHVVSTVAELKVCRRKFFLELVDRIFELSVFHPYVLEFPVLDAIAIDVVAVSVVRSIHAESVVPDHHIVHVSVGSTLYK